MHFTLCVFSARQNPSRCFLRCGVQVQPADCSASNCGASATGRSRAAQSNRCPKIKLRPPVFCSTRSYTLKSAGRQYAKQCNQDTSVRTDGQSPARPDEVCIVTNGKNRRSRAKGKRSSSVKTFISFFSLSVFMWLPSCRSTLLVKK